MGILGALLVAVTVNTGPVEVKTAPVFNPATCSKKRVDACGCHHVYGVRHCHPKRRTDHCESVAQVNESSGKDASRAEQFVEQFFSVEPDSESTEQAQQDSATL
ncbi:hypothetical protein [Vitiosangium sp. GDMCC 1.1324]|uniref:hypothetical protein n=1 Tax=Vitiosangium sp. (strain GDMCC 1.1324) TaxID=2138576 RepID=UPI000D3896B6|nr:hypothetical protein [Vitiosangium sp. GDMCC 1.1324]PTL76993.1 hypothetical protein DAT35_45930 [Vitiosangium sp. GDMCC 1.1324]